MIESLKMVCTLFTPDIPGSVLKGLECPSIYISKWISPGYYTTVNGIRKHVQFHPAQGQYYLTLVLGNLYKNDAAVHKVVTQGLLRLTYRTC